MQDMESRISRWVEEHRDSYIRDVSRLVAIRSVSGEAEEGKPFGPGPAAALEEAMKICREMGFRVTNHEGYVMTADLCAEECALDILAHLDVVGEGKAGIRIHILQQRKMAACTDEGQTTIKVLL